SAAASPSGDALTSYLRHPRPAPGRHVGHLVQLNTGTGCVIAHRHTCNRVGAPLVGARGVGTGGHKARPYIDTVYITVGEDQQLSTRTAGAEGVSGLGAGRVLPGVGAISGRGPLLLGGRVVDLG